MLTGQYNMCFAAFQSFVRSAYRNHRYSVRYPLVKESAQLRLYSDQTTGWTVRLSNPGSGKRFSTFSKRPYRLWGPPNLLFKGQREYVSVVKRSGREVDQAPAFDVKVNEWSCNSTPPLCLNEMGRNNNFCTRIVWGVVSRLDYRELIAIFRRCIKNT